MRHIALIASLLWILSGMSATPQELSPTAEGTAEARSDRRGISIEDDGFSATPWVPFETEDLFVWGADVCLGYLMTRDPASLNGGVIDEHAEPYGLYVELGNMEARLHIFNWPFNKHGVFHCENTSWPQTPPTTETIAELRRWIEERLTADAGWNGTFDPSRAVIWASFRNDDLGVTLRVTTIGNNLTVLVEADYFGPPIILGEFIY